jgi:hypothetical protein
LASVQITSYNLHLGLLRSEHCWGEHRTVYSGRREADVVMTSIRHLTPRRLHIRSQLPALRAPFFGSDVPYFRRESAGYVVALVGRND